MYSYRHVTDLFNVGSGLLVKGSLRTSMMRSQGYMNFLFVRIYKTANLNYLEDQSFDKQRKFRIFTKNLDYSFTQNTLFILYMLRREAFARFCKQLFNPTTLLQRISKYLEWRKLSDAGLCNANLLVHDNDDQNYFCGRVLQQPILHKYEILHKKCDLSAISETHTSFGERFDLRNFVEESEDENNKNIEPRLLHTYSAPSVQKLELALDSTKDSKSMYDEDINESQNNTEWTVNGKIIELISSSGFSLSSSSVSFA